MSEKPTVPSSWEAVEVGWEARAMRQHDEQQAKIAREQGLPVRARIQDEAGQHAVAEAQRFEQVNRPVNGIANAQTFIPPKWLND